MYLNNADMYAVWLQTKLMFVPKVQSLECIKDHTMAHLKRDPNKTYLCIWVQSKIASVLNLF